MPETRYARSGEVNIPYQVLGEGPFDLVWVPGFVSNVELGWQIPSQAAFTTGLARFCRVIRFDKHIPGARYVELSGRAHLPFAGDADGVLATLRSFLEDAWAATEEADVEPHRVLATVLFTDIVGSSGLVAELGDRRWRELLAEHNTRVRRQLARFRGTEHDTAGDGFFASFDGPARAIRCAGAIVQAGRDLGVDVRAGLHSGECELVEGKVAGIAVHIGARVAAEAGPGEVLVSRTVHDLVAGSGLAFKDRGERELRGIPAGLCTRPTDAADRLAFAAGL